tara:strand:+ start:1835 stop:2251 length:417 start_codon:yes stop_codon:yes gene_type:complete
MGCSSSSTTEPDLSQLLDSLIQDLTEWQSSNQDEQSLQVKIRDVSNNAVNQSQLNNTDTSWEVKTSRIMMIRDRMNWSDNITYSLNELINSLNNESDNATTTTTTTTTIVSAAVLPMVVPVPIRDHGGNSGVPMAYAR